MPIFSPSTSPAVGIFGYQLTGRSAPSVIDNAADLLGRGAPPLNPAQTLPELPDLEEVEEEDLSLMAGYTPVSFKL